ncbi:ABC transporter ATP-binding protein [Sulfoacidibacillus thermotolerans]|uniref:ABC transporter n=1 Tax=Sulfoacidibacillus thermotolerans TaxID=1765684 RepID=A0A2U3D690_SULT2|nr:ABC transporter ATP-binding protein [Sulfoacidibacillus thermotolerans]PWI56792.1 ABC transporter [Sulfoacidibacillus thermotolerans]
MNAGRKEGIAQHSPLARGIGGFGGPGGAFIPTQKAKDVKKSLTRLLGYFRPHAFRLGIVFGAAIIGTLFSILGPKILGNATTDLFVGAMSKLRGEPGEGVDFTKILHLLLELGILYFFSSLFSYVQQYLMAGVTQKTIYELRRQVDEKLSRFPLRFYDTHSHGDILSRFINDFDNISNTLQQSLTQLITSAITFVGVIVMMLTISPLMTLVVFLTLPLSFFATKAIASRSQRHFSDQQKSLGQLNGHVEEMYTGHLIVKAFLHEKQAIDTFNEMNGRLYEASWRAQFISGIVMPLMSFIGNLSYVLVSVIGAVLVTQNAITIGDIQAFIQYARQFSQPITQMSSLTNLIQSTLASAERIFDLLDEEEEIATVIAPVKNFAPRGRVQFEHVQFRYRKEEPLITDLNLDVKAGQTVAIVGPTGAGKTTLVNLLMRFYELDSGRILLDGVDITSFERHDLRQMFGMVLQDTWLFHGTIRQNIAYGRENATEQEIIQAAQAANADHFIRTLPDGYDTLLNEEASNLSQGQKQLLTIARAILADPAILILDEATSNVDTRTEAHIQRAMQHLMSGKTSFVIAHRLSTIKEADLILVMQNGSVVEQGTHQELIKKDGFYAELYYSQFGSWEKQEPAI